MVEKDEKAGLSYPSMEDRGYEPVEVPKEDLWPIKGEHYKNFPGVEKMQQKEVPLFLQRRFEDALVGGHIARTMKHYTAAFSGAGVFDPSITAQLKGFIKEMEAALTHEERKGILEKTSDYLRSLKIAKR